MSAAISDGVRTAGPPVTAVSARSPVAPAEQGGAAEPGFAASWVAAWNAFWFTPADPLPLALVRVFAGSLLTFIPASGDFVNAAFLGGTRSRMIGNVVQDRFLVQLDYPGAAAISLLLMAIITSAVLLYAKLLGTAELA